MKKFFYTFLTLVVAAAFVACGDDDNSVPTTPDVPGVENPDEGEPQKPANDDLLLGDYYMIALLDYEGDTLEVQLPLTLVRGEGENNYMVNNFWFYTEESLFASYDPQTKMFTITGESIWAGDGNSYPFFGNFGYYYSQELNQLMGICVFYDIEAEDETGDMPLLITVDPETGKLDKIQNYIVEYIVQYDSAQEKITDFVGFTFLIEPGAQVYYGTAQAPDVTSRAALSAKVRR